MPATPPNPPQNQPPSPPVNPATNTPPTANQAPYPPVPPAQQAAAAMTTDIPQTTKPKKGSKKLIAIVLLMLILIISLLTTGVLLIAYEKVSMGNKDLQNRISMLVLSIPFLPKTPKYVVLTSYDAHKDITSSYIDASFSMQSDSLPEPFNLIPLAFTASGAMDYSDPENPISDINIDIASQFNLDARTIGATSYFKINRLPVFLFDLLGIENVDPFNALTNQWFYIDQSMLANTPYDLQSESELSELNEKYERLFLEFAEEDVVPKLQLSNESLEGIGMHKLNMELDSAEFAAMYQEITEKLFQELYEDLGTTNLYGGTPEFEAPEELEVVRFSAWVDKKNYLVRKMEVYMKFNSTTSTGDTMTTNQGVANSENDLIGPRTTTFQVLDDIQEVELTFTVNLSRFGEKFDISAPGDAIPFEEFLVQVSGAFGADSPFPFVAAFAQDFTKAKVDVDLMVTMTDLYYATEKSYPTFAELIDSDIVSDKILTTIATSRIQYQTSPDQNTVVLYSTIPNPENSVAPYYAAVVSNTLPRSLGNYSAEELNSLLISIGLQADPLLGTSASGQFVPQSPPVVPIEAF